VEPWGWTWIDEAPWGFAPFHYGRWAMYRGSWVWVPGTRVARPVYAPALVVFVGGRNGGTMVAVGGGMQGVAWFPLGPHEVYRPSYRYSDRYIRQVNVTHVSVTNINVTNVRYVNQNQGAVTVVSRDVFVGARPVRNAHMTVGVDVIAQGRVFGSTAGLAPERSSVMVHSQVTNVRPPARFEGRTVVVRQAPPPPPVSFGARREALQRDPGRPLDRGTAEALRRNEQQSSPVYRQAPGRPITPAATTPRTEAPRVDQPRQVYVPDQARPVGQPRQVEQPRVEQPRPVPIRRDQPTQGEQPRRSEQPVRVEQVRPVEQPRQVEQPRVEQPQSVPIRREQPRVEQPRPVERPRPAEAPRVEQARPPREQQAQPRTEQPRPQQRQAERTERKPESKAEPKKDEKKQ
jgi:hypothetical protein